MTCLIYVHTDRTEEELAETVAQVLGLGDCRGASPSILETPDYYITVRANEVADDERATQFPKGFLNFPLYVEFSALDDSPEADADSAGAVGRILQHFWDNEVPAVAECSFDELLPLGGGYAQRDLPWPSAPPG